MRVKGPRSNKMEHSYWSRAINWTQGFWMRIQDELPRPIEAKLRWHLHDTILEGNSIGPYQKMELKGEFMVWKTNM